MKWTDTLDIAIELCDKYPDTDPLSVNFVDLTNMVMELDGFTGYKDKVGEKILESIQMNWLEERE